MGARKHSGRKIRLLKKQKQTSAVPAWVIMRTNKTVELILNVELGDRLMWKWVRCLRMLNVFIQ